MIKVGIIGYGKMGQIRHKCIMENNNANLVSIFEPSDINVDVRKVETPNHIIKDPEISKAIYSTLDGVEHFYKIKSDEDFNMYIFHII